MEHSDISVSRSADSLAVRHRIHAWWATNRREVRNESKSGAQRFTRVGKALMGGFRSDSSTVQAQFERATREFAYVHGVLPPCCRGPSDRPRTHFASPSI
jgi:hypothetical protein